MFYVPEAREFICALSGNILNVSHEVLEGGQGGGGPGSGGGSGSLGI